MLIFDLETDGLLKELTTIHCLAIYDTETDEISSYNDQTLSEPIHTGINRLVDADSIAGHNIIYFDLPAINRIYSWFNPPDNIVDTLLLSRLYHSDQMSSDCKKKYDHMPGQLFGRHSLESYGYRLGEYKGEFSKTTDWKEWSQEMEDYCIQDVKVTTKLCDHFRPYLTGSH